MGEMWRSGYDMSPGEFEVEVERLWGQVEPLYEALHCYVRDELTEKYGADRVPPEGPIPAHLLGNMWSQQWGQIYDIVEPYPGVTNLDVTAALRGKDYDASGMTRTAEGFFTSLAMPALPESFWERSMLTRPRDREVVCHASAWNMNPAENDVRIKQCIVPTQGNSRPSTMSSAISITTWPITTCRICSARVPMTVFMRASATPSICR